MLISIVTLAQYTLLPTMKMLWAAFSTLSRANYTENDDLTFWQQVKQTKHHHKHWYYLSHCEEAVIIIMQMFEHRSWPSQTKRESCLETKANKRSPSKLRELVPILETTVFGISSRLNCYIFVATTTAASFAKDKNFFNFLSPFWGESTLSPSQRLSEEVERKISQKWSSQQLGKHIGNSWLTCLASFLPETRSLLEK